MKGKMIVGFAVLVASPALIAGQPSKICKGFLAIKLKRYESSSCDPHPGMVDF